MHQLYLTFFYLKSFEKEEMKHNFLQRPLKTKKSNHCFSFLQHYPMNEALLPAPDGSLLAELLPYPIQFEQNLPFGRLAFRTILRRPLK